MDQQDGSFTARAGTILAIDDDEDILIVVRTYLESIGYDVLATTDVDEAQRLAPTHPIDLVLCDVGMPKQTGLDVCERLRDSGYRGKVVLMTGWDEQRVRIDQRAQSCDGVLKKPFLGTELIAVIDSMLAGD